MIVVIAQASATPFDIAQTGVAIAVLLYVVWQLKGSLDQRLAVADNAHAKELDNLREAHAREVDRLQRSHADEIERLQRSHANEMQAIGNLHTQAIERLRSDIAAAREDAADSRAALAAYRNRVEDRLLPATLQATSALERLIEMRGGLTDLAADRR